MQAVACSLRSVWICTVTVTDAEQQYLMAAACAKRLKGLKQHHSIVEGSETTPQVCAHEQNNNTVIRSTECFVVG